jgi:peptide/nickel transport system permease protein
MGELSDIADLFIDYILLLINSFAVGINQLSISLADHFISLILIILLPLLFFYKRKKYKFLYQPLKLNYAILIVILIFGIFSPLIKDDDFKSDIDKFRSNYSWVLGEIIGENYFIADSIKQNENIFIYQKNSKTILERSSLIEKNLSFQTSQIVFLLGTDEFGRDIFSRLLYGTRLSLFIGLGSVIVSLIIGLTFGFLAGFYGGVIDILLNRLTEMFLAFPIIFLIILIVALFGNSLIIMILILGFAGWMSLFKVVRSEIASLKNKDFIITSINLGFSNYYILVKEMLPVILSPIVVNLVLQFGNVILAESALSYLGIGIGNYYPTWGAMIQSGQYYLSNAWWMSLFPSLLLFVTLFTANNFGRELEVRFNPRHAR